MGYSRQSPCAGTSSSGLPERDGSSALGLSFHHNDLMSYRPPFLDSATRSSSTASSMIEIRSLSVVWFLTTWGACCVNSQAYHLDKPFCLAGQRQSPCLLRLQSF